MGRVGFLCLARAPEGPSGLELFSALGVPGQTARAASQLSLSCREPPRVRQCLHAMGWLSGLGAPQFHGNTCSAVWRLRSPCKYSLVGASGRDAEPGRSVPRVWGQHFEVGCRRQGRAAPPARLSCLKSQAGRTPGRRACPDVLVPGWRLPALCLGDASVIWGAGRGRSAPGVLAVRSHSPAAPGTGAWGAAGAGVPGAGLGPR